MKSAGVPSLLLMEHAAEAVAKAAYSHTPRKILTVAGYGNNGADGLAASRILKGLGIDSDILLIGNADRSTDEWKIQSRICNAAGINFYIGIDDLKAREPDAANAYDVVIDALLGIGSSRELTGEYLRAAELINGLKDHNKFLTVIAVDIPTGLHPDTGKVLGKAVNADETVTFFRLKSGLLLNKGREYSGSISIADPMPVVGADESFIDDDRMLMAVDDDDMLKAFKRDRTGNKATFGKVLCICGSAAMPGACILNARAAFNSGVGMVKILSDEKNRDLLMHEVPEVMFSSYNGIPTEDLEKAVAWCDCMIIGCGLGTSSEARELFHRAVKIADRMGKYLVIDADGLNILSGDISLLKDLNIRPVLTPHPGEWRRLFPEQADAYNDPDAVKILANEYKCVIAAKDATTIISDGALVFLNKNGNEGMATAGSGDVLAGIMGALLAGRNNESNVYKAALAVYLHGAAGDLASKNKGSVSVTASDIIDEIHAVITDKSVNDLCERVIRK
ncbi:MAG: NAD(P)H-hydrate dehydratase [Lachnospiraceae bacterium]|nr:NAD(P)H-hydrate dehydratase [Lachnospiraceae bacterium]